MIWIPIELILEIFSQKLIGRCDFRICSFESMRLDQAYNNNLLNFALTCKEWSAIAQSELFKNLILGSRRDTGRFLELVGGSATFRGYASGTSTLRVGHAYADYEVDGLSGDLDEIALRCPNVVEISCFKVSIKLEIFRTSFHLVFCEEEY
jgi:hypothetical protein